MTEDPLARLLAALGRPADPAEAKRPRGRPPALTPGQVEYARRQRRRPRADRPRLDELAAELRVDLVTLRRALQARPPYDWGEPAPRRGGRHRDRGAGRFPPEA